MNKTLQKILSACISAVMAFSIATAIPNTASAGASYTLNGTAHVQDYGDTEGSFSSGTLTLGTRGNSKRVESICVNFDNQLGYDGTIQYQVHVQNIGWMNWVNAGETAGTSHQSLRLEGLRMRLTGELANHYTIMYHVHIQDYGDAQGWVSDGALAGTTGESKRLEEVQIKIVPIGYSSNEGVANRVHCQDYGWESAWSADGAVSGTTGSSKRLEAISIALTGAAYKGSISYKTHVQDYGWQDWVSDGTLSGTQGEGKRLEAIQIKLTGDIADHYDIYYRVHSQNFGWLDWACNGASAGTSGFSYRLEAIQIELVAKGSSAPGSVSLSFIDKSTADAAAAALADAQKHYNEVVLDWIDTQSTAAGGHTVEYYVNKAASDNLVPGTDLSIYTRFLTADNINKSVDYIAECNSLRASEGIAPLQVNSALMAASIGSAVISSKTYDHIAFHNGYFSDLGGYRAENLAWGYADPFTGWYTDEKASKGGHYVNIINPVYTQSGFAFASFSETGYMSNVAEEMFGSISAANSMTPSAYKTAFNQYVADAASALSRAQTYYSLVSR